MEALFLLSAWEFLMQRQTHKSWGPKGQAAASLKHFKVAGRFSARQIKANASHNAEEMIRKARERVREVFFQSRGENPRKSAHFLRTKALRQERLCGISAGKPRPPRFIFRRFSDAAFDVLPFREKSEGSLKKDRIPFLSRLCWGCVKRPGKSKRALVLGRWPAICLNSKKKTIRESALFPLQSLFSTAFQAASDLFRHTKNITLRRTRIMNVISCCRLLYIVWALHDTWYANCMLYTFHFLAHLTSDLLLQVYGSKITRENYGCLFDSFLDFMAFAQYIKH